MNPATIVKGFSAATFLILLFSEIKGFLQENNHREDQFGRTSTEQYQTKGPKEMRDLGRERKLSYPEIRTTPGNDRILAFEKLASTRAASRARDLSESGRKIEHPAVRLERDIIRSSERYSRSFLNFNSRTGHNQDFQTKHFRTEERQPKLADNRISERIQRYGNDQRQRQINRMTDRSIILNNERNNMRQKGMLHSSRESAFRISRFENQRSRQRTSFSNPSKDMLLRLDISKMDRGRRITNTAGSESPRYSQRIQQIAVKAYRENGDSYIRTSENARTSERNSERNYLISERSNIISRQGIESRLATSRINDKREDFRASYERRPVLDLREIPLEKQDTTGNLKQNKNLERENIRAFSRNSRDVTREVSTERKPVGKIFSEVRRNVNNLREGRYTQRIHDTRASFNDQVSSGMNSNFMTRIAQRSQNIRDGRDTRKSSFRINSEDRSWSSARSSGAKDDIKEAASSVIRNFNSRERNYAQENANFREGARSSSYRRNSENKLRILERSTTRKDSIRNVASERSFVTHNSNNIIFREGSYTQKIRRTRETASKIFNVDRSFEDVSRTSSRRSNERRDVRRIERKEYRNSEDHTNSPVEVRNTNSVIFNANSHQNRRIRDLHHRVIKRSVESMTNKVRSGVFLKESPASYDSFDSIHVGSSLNENRAEISALETGITSKSDLRSHIKSAKYKFTRLLNTYSPDSEAVCTILVKKRDQVSWKQNNNGIFAKTNSTTSHDIIEKKLIGQDLHHAKRMKEIVMKKIKPFMSTNEMNQISENEMDFIAKINLPVFGNWCSTIQITLATVILGQLLIFNGEKGKDRSNPLKALNHLMASFGLFESPY